MERMTAVPTTSYCWAPRLLSVAYLLSDWVNYGDSAPNSRMSVFNHLATLVPKASASSKQAKEHPPACLSSPVIKKKPIQIPSFDEKGLVYEKHITKQIQSERSFVPICSPKTSSPPTWSKSIQYSQRNYGERASTLPRTKPKTFQSPTLSANPCISISLAPNSSPTPLEPKSRDSLHPHASHLSDPSPFLHQPPPKQSVSPTLVFPTPRLTPSPTGMRCDGQGGKQPSPVAQERRARSITISNPKVRMEPCKQRPLNVVKKHDVLDQAALLEFTHAVLKRASSMTGRDIQRQRGRIPNSSTQGKACLNKKDQNAKDKSNPLCKNRDITANSELKSDIKQQQELLQSRVTGTQTCSLEASIAKTAHKESQPAMEGQVTQSSLNHYRKCKDFKKTYTAGYNSNEQSNQQKDVPRMSFSTEPPLKPSAVSSSIECWRQLDLKDDTKAEKTFSSGSNLRRPQEEGLIQRTTENLCQLPPKKSPQKLKFWLSQSPQIDVKNAVTQSDCASKDYQSKAIDQKTEAPQCSHRLNRLKTCLLAPQSQEACRPDSVHHTLKPDVSQKHPLNHNIYESHRGMSFTDKGLNQTDIFALSDHHRVLANLPEHPSEKRDVSWPPSTAQCPLNTSSFGISSDGLFDYKACKRPNTAATAATLPLQRLNNSLAGRAFIMEEAEDPYYVTMYYPGSVYVGE